MYRFKKCTIEGFEHYYIMYKSSVVINAKTGKFVKGWLNKNGYRRIQLSNKGNQRKFYLHRLVALAWLINDDPENKIEVNHIDRNRQNCDAMNLEWCTKDYNLAYRYNKQSKMFDEIQMM